MKTTAEGEGEKKRSPLFFSECILSTWCEWTISRWYKFLGSHTFCFLVSANKSPGTCCSSRISSWSSWTYVTLTDTRPNYTSKLHVLNLLLEEALARVFHFSLVFSCQFLSRALRTRSLSSRSSGLQMLLFLSNRLFSFLLLFFFCVTLLGEKKRLRGFSGYLVMCQIGLAMQRRRKMTTSYVIQSSYNDCDVTIKGDTSSHVPNKDVIETSSSWRCYVFGVTNTRKTEEKGGMKWKATHSCCKQDPCRYLLVAVNEGWVWFVWHDGHRKETDDY